MARATSEDGTATAPVENKPQDRVNMGVGLPFGLKEIIEAAAKEKNISASAWTRDFLAEHFKYELPASQRGGGKKKYASEEERVAAREQAVKRRAALVKTLMDRYKADPEMQAEINELVEVTLAAEDDEAETPAEEPVGATA